MNRKWLVSLAPLAIVASVASAAPVLAAPPSAQVVPGEVVAVAGTPNLWVADSQGVIHFASDPRALAGRSVNWNEQLDLTPDQLATLPVGDPWLTAALVKIGDSIYIPQWGANASAPTLFRVQSPEDLGQLGINADNYGQLVLDLPTWEQRNNLSLDRVEFDGDFNLTPPTAAAAADTNNATSDNGNSGDTAADTTANTTSTAEIAS